ncbi:hypothetical protein TUBRATIS_11140 [Tubulinosema ratisbonensis]|uniref:Uncharacterized protein n=1 Tax=Tubulinosema ratisbonensis TaxID=291195 RepID=A0A437AMK6_9MICR|nr:hypothetical protein TUBRATIS_11140 [Tubulinosema ratisbonensis]
MFILNSLKFLKIFFNLTQNSESNTILYNLENYIEYKIDKLESIITTTSDDIDYQTQQNNGDSENLSNLLINLQGCIELQKRFSYLDAMYICGTKIITREAWEFPFKHYLFDMKNLFELLDVNCEFTNIFFSMRSPHDKFTQRMAIYFFDFLIYEKVQENNYLLYQNNMKNALEFFITDFILQFNNHIINAKKLHKSEFQNFLCFLNNRLDIRLRSEHLKQLIKFLWKRLINDRGYRILFILFPELLYLIQSSLEITYITYVKKIHLLIGFIVFRIQANLKKIKSEILNLKAANLFSIHHSEFLNYFIYKTRLYACIMIYLPKTEKMITHYFVFLAFLSYLRVYCGQIFLVFLYDDDFCSNISVKKAVEFYYTYFFLVNIKMCTISNKLEITKFEIKKNFVDCTKDVHKIIPFDFTINGFFVEETETFCFENIYQFKESLVRETFIAMLDFFEINKE